MSLAIGFILVVFGVFLFWRGPTLPALNPIKSLFPSWRFFDRLGHYFTLDIKNLEHHYEPLFIPLNTHWTQLFWNPKGNLRHAQISLIQIWLQNPENPLQKKQIEQLIAWEKPYLPKPYHIKIWSHDQKLATKECIYQGLLNTHE